MTGEAGGHPEAEFELLNVHKTLWKPFPEFGGSQALLYQSDDGSRMAATFRLSGRHSWTLEYDDFFYVIAGHASIEIDGRPALKVGPGDFCRLHQGSAVTFDMSADFHEVSVLISENGFDHSSPASD